LDVRAAGVHGLHDVDAVDQAACCPVPFSQHQDALGRQGIDGFGEFGAVLHILARNFFAINLIAAFSAKSRDLPVEVLVEARHARVADFQHKSTSSFATISWPPKSS